MRHPSTRSIRILENVSSCDCTHGRHEFVVPPGTFRREVKKPDRSLQAKGSCSASSIGCRCHHGLVYAVKYYVLHLCARACSVGRVTEGCIGGCRSTLCTFANLLYLTIVREILSLQYKVRYLFPKRKKGVLSVATAKPVVSGYVSLRALRLRTARAPSPPQLKPR